MTARTVVTGIGVVAPTGLGTGPYWRATLEARSGIGPRGGQVTGFRPEDWVTNKLRVQTDRWTWFALAAAEMALADAALSPGKQLPFHLSVVTAAGSGGNEFGQREEQALWGDHPSKVSAYQSIAWFYAAGTGQLSIRHGLTGGCAVVCADGAGGLDALAQARRLLRRGGEAALVGGTEAPLSPFALACHATHPAASRPGGAAEGDRSGEGQGCGEGGPSAGGYRPGGGYRPFHPGASGFVPGEGGALMVLEERAHAAARGARIYAELLGHAATHDAHHHTHPALDGVQLARAITTALRRADREPGDVDVVFADGAGHPLGDAAEAAALRRVFGDRLAALPVTVPKAGTGRLVSGAGALDTVAAALCLRTGVVPPTPGADAAAGLAAYGIRLADRRLRPGRLRTALVVARGTGGFNSAAVLGKADVKAMEGGGPG